MEVMASDDDDEDVEVCGCFTSGFDETTDKNDVCVCSCRLLWYIFDEPTKLIAMYTLS